MMQENTQTDTAVPVSAESTTVAPVATEGRGAQGGSPRRGGGDRGGREKNARRPRRGGRREERARSEFDQKMIDIRRVARVVAGGRRFSFSVAVVIGNRKGKVGVGLGKAGDTQLAIEKATRAARRALIEVPMNKHQHIPHDTKAKLGASQIMIMPAPGRGLVAGSSVRTVLELAGVKDVTAKILSRSKNHLNNARATVAALKKLKVR
jgi:small subunit ribosomal protein S5